MTDTASHGRMPQLRLSGRRLPSKAVRMRRSSITSPGAIRSVVMTSAMPASPGLLDLTSQVAAPATLPWLPTL